MFSKIVRPVITTIRNKRSEYLHEFKYNKNKFLIDTLLIVFFYFSPMPPPVLMNLVVFPPGCGYSVADLWGWDAHEAQLRCPDEVSDDMCEDEIPGWALKSKSTNYPDHGHHGDLPLPGKIPMVEPGIEPGTSSLVVTNLDD